MHFYEKRRNVIIIIIIIIIVIIIIIIIITIKRKENDISSQISFLAFTYRKANTFVNILKLPGKGRGVGTYSRGDAYIF